MAEEQEKPKRKTSSPRRSSRRSKNATEAGAKKTADEAAEVAKANKAIGRRLSAAKTQLRNSAIMARVAQGITNELIAAEFKLSVRTIERIREDNRSVRSPLETSPMQLLEELATGFKLAIGDYEAMALAWFDSNQTAALGAKKAADETRVRLAALLAEVGKLPSNLELFRSEMEMQRIADEMVGKMRAVAAGELDASEAVEFFRQLIAKGSRPELPAPAPTP